MCACVGVCVRGEAKINRKTRNRTTVCISKCGIRRTAISDANKTSILVSNRPLRATHGASTAGLFFFFVVTVPVGLGFN